ncbi:uncharacterized protein LOC144181697 [Stigmatopora nigra]
MPLMPAEQKQKEKETEKLETLQKELLNMQIQEAKFLLRCSSLSPLLHLLNSTQTHNSSLHTPLHMTGTGGVVVGVVVEEAERLHSTRLPGPPTWVNEVNLPNPRRGGGHLPSNTSGQGPLHKHGARRAEGVAAVVELDEEQRDWYRMPADCAPHVSLALSPSHQAKDLAPMIRHMYKVVVPSCDSGVARNQWLTRAHGAEKTDAEGTEQMLSTLPTEIWSQGPTDYPVAQRQYFRPKEEVIGITDTINGLLDSGVLEPSSSVWNTPILPVKKGEGRYRMVHDLRLINKLITTPLTGVPNPFVSLAAITPSHTHFTVVDLANAFFCLPLAEHLRDVFSFTHLGRQLRYTRLPQGFLLSPGLFNQTLKSVLSSLTLPSDSIVIQYVDDLLIASPSEASCLTTTHSLLTHLATTGFKVSRKKLQCARTSVSFLGRLVTSDGTAMSSSHQSSILNHAKPRTVRQMLSFLGLAGYSRHFVPDYSSLTLPLRKLVNDQGMRNLNAPLEWDTAAEEVFISVKQLLSKAAALQRPDYSKQFYLDVSEKEGSVAAVLFQKREGTGDRLILTYVSMQLDPIEAKHPNCVRYAAALGKCLQKIDHIVMQHPLTVLTSHAVAAFVSSAEFTLTPRRTDKLDRILHRPNVTYKTEGVNMADGIAEGTPHCCAELTLVEQRLREGLQATPLTHPDMTFFTDGCCFRHPTEGLKSAYAVTQDYNDNHTDFIVVESDTITGKQSAQRAELIAMIRALEKGRTWKINIYTDSAYVIGSIFVDLPLWKRNGFLTATGAPVKHQEEMMALERALDMPAEVAIMKCRAHTNGMTFVDRGNASADAEAKRTAGFKGPESMMVLNEEQLANVDVNSILIEQQKASPEEISYWLSNG